MKMNRFNEPIDEEFDKALLFLKQGKLIFDKSFKQALFEFFDKHKSDPHEVHDALFNNFSLFWSQSDNILLGENVYKKILPLVHEWEDINRPHKLHKGTPYYFYAVFSILKDDLERGLLLMHQAYSEDQRAGKTSTPAGYFIRLEDKPLEQFFRSKVRKTANFLDTLLENYRNAHSTSLNLESLRDKFLGLSQYEEESFFFVYCIFKLEKIIKRIEKEIRANRMASHIETTSIFELCKLAEVLLVDKFPSNRHIDFIVRIEKLCQDSRVSLNLKQNNLGFLNGERDSDFKNTIGGLIDHTYSHQRFVSSPAPIEFDIALTYCLRNFGGHKIEDQKLIYERFDHIIQGILNTIFFIIEKVY